MYYDTRCAMVSVYTRGRTLGLVCRSVCLELVVPGSPCSGETGPLSGVSHLSMGIAGRISKISLNVCFVLFCGEVRNRQSEDNT